eukprot:CAMPEP_0116843170 /NCGR_PEP_ID=MMETSP0418-20121206/11935_1 /TAXON_ID=1158023 /ORGANISM="Astrosyne radiata, Strain 13vi08-1A" /LENGTH=102 /DNA_ID=CAMNT_0004473885 /DNA_START=177 /DNA_END=485 /DNA_ORIENTATION=-
MIPGNNTNAPELPVRRRTDAYRAMRRLKRKKFLEAVGEAAPSTDSEVPASPPSSPPYSPRLRSMQNLRDIILTAALDEGSSRSFSSSFSDVSTASLYSISEE